MPHQTLPQFWMMTDDRMGDALWPALYGLPAASGVIVRHYGLSDAARIKLGRRIVALARRRGLIVLWSGNAHDAAAIGADGVHAGRGQRLPPRSHHPRLIRSAPVHDARELRRAERRGADMVLLSPIYATQSHPDAVPLGPMRAAALALMTPLPVIALGGMTPQRGAHLMRLGFAGWAGISAFAKQ